MIRDGELWWMAGLFDGEGSIGIFYERKPGRRPVLRTQVQMSMTCETTIKELIRRCTAAGVRSIGYTYQERDPAKHRDAHYIRITRIPDVATLAALMVHRSTTKRRQWALIAEFCRSRLVGATIDAQGRIHRGGPHSHAARAYTDRELAIAEEIGLLNQRGPERITADAS
jgi:hypothetical protein